MHHPLSGDELQSLEAAGIFKNISNDESLLQGAKPFAEEFPMQLQFMSELDIDAAETTETRSISITQSSSGRAISILPPDTGYAWIFLASAFVVEFLTFGLAYSTGVMHAHWISKLFPNGSKVILAQASTLMTGCLFIACLVVHPLFQLFPQRRATFQYLGAVIASAGLISSAFATSPIILLLTIAVVWPFGAALLYLPTGSLLFQWFAKRRGLAAGVAYSSGGIGGAVFPFLLQSLFERYGWRVAMTGVGVAYIVPTTIAVYFVRERIPPTAPAHKYRQHDRHGKDRQNAVKFFTSKAILLYTVAVLAMALASILPNIALPSYVSYLNLSESYGTGLVSILNGTSALGMIVLGALADRWPVRIITAVATMAASLSVLLVWGFAVHAPLLFLFSVIFGFFGLGFPSLWPRIVTALLDVDAHAGTSASSTLLFTFFCATGVGNIVSGPVSDYLLSSPGFRGAHFAYGVESYGPLIIYTGGMCLLSSLAAYFSGAVRRSTSD